jgi:hypothetical protein
MNAGATQNITMPADLFNASFGAAINATGGTTWMVHQAHLTN